jgi:hypothetical protein
MPDPPKNRADIATNTNTNSTAEVPVNPLSQVAVAILYGERVRFPNEDMKNPKERMVDWKWECPVPHGKDTWAEWETTPAAEALSEAEEDFEKNPFADKYAPAGDWIPVAPPDNDGPAPDPQFAGAPDLLAAQLKDAGEVIKLPLRQAGLLQSKHKLPLAAVLVISHGDSTGAIAKYTYLRWKYYTPRKPWRQWWDRNVGEAWDIDIFVKEVVNLRRKGLLVVYGCHLGAPGNRRTRQEAANSAGIAIAGWGGLVDWEVPGAAATLDRTLPEVWNKLKFKDEETRRTILKKKKQALVGTGKVSYHSPLSCDPGDLVPSSIVEAEPPEEADREKKSEKQKRDKKDHKLASGSNVIALIRQTASRVLQELASERAQRGPRR